jgi:hypothetical protein
MIEIYGRDSFVTEILLENGENDNFYWYEQELIKEFLNHPLCLNKHYFDPKTHCRISKDGMLSATSLDNVYFDRGGWQKDGFRGYVPLPGDTRRRFEILADALNCEVNTVRKLYISEIRNSLSPDDKKIWNNMQYRQDIEKVIPSKKKKFVPVLSKETKLIKEDIISRLRKKK